MSYDPLELARIQRWMQAVIMHPEGVAAGVNSGAARSEIDVSAAHLEQVISRSRALGSLKRLHVYGNAYYARLLECLRDEFPATAHAVGTDTFDGFAFGYLQAYPSTSYTLARLGSNFPRYLAETRPPRESDGDEPDWADFLIDLATLERVYSEVFDGPGVEGQPLLAADDLAGIPPERFAGVRLVPASCLRLLELRFPVHEFATAVRQGRGPDVPRPAPTYLAITRRDFVVRRQAVSRARFDLLASLSAGRTLGEAIEAVLAGSDATVAGSEAAFDDLAGNLRQWFADWAAAGYFERIEAGEAAQASGHP
ncbi:MAG TPA: DNA-binding domain-containing protein [Planctomycetaceae bacterium]|nr:DNA-binding domain-containing protein [Planctomycetaceae bacterium]